MYVFSKSKNATLLENFYLNSIPIKFVSSFKHLSHLLSSRACYFSTDQIMKDIKCKTNAIVNFFNFAAVDTKTKLFNSFCSTYYDSVLYDIEDLVKIDVVWRTCATWNIGQFKCKTRNREENFNFFKRRA